MDDYNEELKYTVGQHGMRVVDKMARVLCNSNNPVETYMWKQHYYFEQH